MHETPWLSIVGLGEDGLNSLPPASLKMLQNAEIIMGARRHLSLLPEFHAQIIEWPVPFADGIAQLLTHRGKRVVALASGDPFWFGAGAVLARHLATNEWQAFAGPSTFSLAATQMGWPLESTPCLGLHAAPLTRLRPYLQHGQRAIVLLRDGESVPKLASYLADMDFAQSQITVMEALGGPRQRITLFENITQPIQHPVCVAIEFSGTGQSLSQSAGQMDQLFDHDGQITKRPVRALTLSALAPRAGEHLWDLGAGSGSIAIEWLLSHPSTQATAVESHPERSARIVKNAHGFGVERLKVVEGASQDQLQNLAPPDAVFIGGGLSSELLETLWRVMPEGCRLVANAVTLEAEALLALWQENKGGELMRIELAQAKPLGRKRGWSSAYPIVQWSVRK